ncbi:DUF2848 family protein [Mycobacterium kansasii]
MTYPAPEALTLQVLDSSEALRFGGVRTLVAGYTGRDQAAVARRIAELAAIGVAPPSDVPMFFSIELSSISTATFTPVRAGHTTGEIEPVLLRHCGRHFLGVGSDHTDRELESTSASESKRVCPKPIGPTVIEVDDWHTFAWDDCRARSWVDGKLYQDGTLVDLRRPAELLDILADRLGDLGDDLLCFAGTLPLLDGEFVSGDLWELELTLPDGRTLTHEYTTTTQR